MTQTTIKVTFTDEQLNLLLDRFLDQYRHNPDERKGEKYAEQYKKIFKKVGKDGSDFYWDRVDDLSEYGGTDNDYKQWLIDTGECGDWEEAGDIYAELDWDGCKWLDWSFTESPNADEYRRRETRNIKDLYIFLLEEEYDDYESENDLLNKAIIDIELTQKILADLAK